MLWLSVVFSAIAGPHRPLCEKIQAADLVIEISFNQAATYPKEYRQKQWAPPQSELNRTISTGVIQTVFKGMASTGQQIDSSWRLSLHPGGGTAKDWDKFLSIKDFKQVFFLRKVDSSYVTTGWAEESAPCGSSPHRSWCEHYADFQRKIQECLASTVPQGPIEIGDTTVEEKAKTRP